MSLQLTGIGFKGIGFANVLKKEMHSTQKVKNHNFYLFTRKFLSYCIRSLIKNHLIIIAVQLIGNW